MGADLMEQGRETVVIEVHETVQYTTPRRMAYASLLHHCVNIGFVMLLVSFGLYATGLLKAHVPLETLPSQWTLSAKDFMAANQLQGGWSWVRLVHRGDYLCFVGLAFLALTTVFCYLRVLPFFLREKKHALAVVIVLEVIVLLSAASGVFSIAH